MTAAFSAGLVASGLGAVPVGRLIDLGYGRAVMASGSIAAAALFVAWSRIESYGFFVALWIGLGLTMSAVLGTSPASPSCSAGSASWPGAGSPP